MDRRLPKWRNTSVPPGTRQSLPSAGSGRLCMGTRGKDMGTRSVYHGRRDTLHSGRLSEAHGPTKPCKYHSSRTRVENIWTSSHTTTRTTTNHHNHTGARRCEGGLESGEALMLVATEPQAIRQLQDRFTDGRRSPVRTRRLRLMWLPVLQETTSPTATLTPLRMQPPRTHHTTPQRLPQQLRQRRSNTDTNNGGTRTPTQQQERAAQDSTGQPRKDASGTAGPL